MKTMRDYINLVETAMQESKNKEAYEYHRDMAKLDTRPGRKDIHNALANKYGKRMDDEKKAQKPQGVAEGADFGAYYSEEVAQKIFDKRQDITSEDEVLNQAYHIVANEQGQKTARYKFNYDEDFPSDVVSNYFWLQKQQGVAEGVDTSNLTNIAQATGKLKGREAFVWVGDPRIPLSNRVQFKRGIIDDREQNYGIQPGTGSRYTYWLKDEDGKDFRAPERDVFVSKQGVAEEQLEETTPDAIAEISRLTRRP